MRYPWKGEHYSFSYAADFYLKPARTKKGISIPSATLGHQLKLIEKKVRSLDEKNPRFLQNIITVEKEFSSIAIKIYKLIDKKKLLCYRKKPIAKFRNAYLLWELYQEMLRLIGFLQKKQVLFQANNIITYSCHFTKEKVTNDNSNDFFFADNRFFKKDFIQIFLFLGAKKKKKSIGSAILEYTKPNTPDIFATDKYGRPNTPWIVRSLMATLEDDWLARNPHKEAIDAKSRKSSCNYSLPSIWDIYNSATKFPGAFRAFLFSKSGARFAAGALTTCSGASSNKQFGQSQFDYSRGTASHGLSSHVQTSNTPSPIPFGTVPQEHVRKLPQCKIHNTIEHCYEEIESKEIFAWSENEKELLEWFRSLDILENTGFLGRSDAGEVDWVCTFPTFMIKKFVAPFDKPVTGSNSAINKILHRKFGRHEDMHGLAMLKNMYSGNCYCSGLPYSTQDGRDRFMEASSEMENNLKKFALDVKLGRSTNADTLSRNLTKVFQNATGCPHYVIGELMPPKKMVRVDARTYRFYPYAAINEKHYLSQNEKTEFANLFSQSLSFKAQYYLLEAVLNPRRMVVLFPDKPTDTMLLATYAFFDYRYYNMYMVKKLYNKKPLTHKFTANTLRTFDDLEKLQQYWDFFSPGAIKSFSPKLSAFYDEFFEEIADIQAGNRDQHLANCSEYIPLFQARLLDDRTIVERLV